MRSNALRGMQAMRGRARMTGSSGRPARKAGHVKKAWRGREGKDKAGYTVQGSQRRPGRTGQCRQCREGQRSVEQTGQSMSGHAGTPGRQERSVQGSAGQAGQADNLGHAGKEGQGRQARQAGQYRKCWARKLGKAGQGR